MVLKKYIRSIPDYPKKGILFRDITTLIKNESAFKECSTSNWVLLKGINGLEEWTPWTLKFDKNFYQKICKDINS